MGCKNIKITRRSLWGLGKYQHKIQRRNSMFAAFVHFSPKDENIKVYSGNWKLKDLRIINVDNFNYNFQNGL